MALSRVFSMEILDSILNDSYNVSSPAPVNEIRVLSGAPASWSERDGDSWAKLPIEYFQQVDAETYQMITPLVDGSSTKRVFSIPAGEYVGRVVIGATGMASGYEEILRFNADPSSDQPYDYSIAGDYTVNMLKLKINNDVLN